MAAMPAPADLVPRIVSLAGTTVNPRVL
jgi:hypothetical protein